MERRCTQDSKCKKCTRESKYFFFNSRQSMAKNVLARVNTLFFFLLTTNGKKCTLHSKWGVCTQDSKWGCVLSTVNGRKCTLDSEWKRCTHDRAPGHTAGRSDRRRKPVRPPCTACPTGRWKQPHVLHSRHGLHPGTSPRRSVGTISHVVTACIRAPLPSRSVGTISHVVTACIRAPLPSGSVGRVSHQWISR